MTEDEQKLHDDITRAKDAMDKVNTAATAVHEFTETARKLAEEGKKLSGAQDTLKGVKMFGKLSTSLAVANIGLDIALMAFGLTPDDPNELILGAVDALDTKVDAMWRSVDSKFTRATWHREKISADQAINAHLNYFDGLRRLVREYRLNPSGETLLTDDLYKPALIADGLNQMAVLLESSDVGQNPLIANDKYFFGDKYVLDEVAGKIVAAAVFAPMVYSLVATLRYKVKIDSEITTPAKVEAICQTNIDSIIDACVKKLDELETPEIFNANMKNRLRFEVTDLIDIKGYSGKPNKGSNLFHAPVNQVCSVLKPAFPFLKILVVIGEASIGPDDVFINPGSDYHKHSQFYASYDVTDIDQEYTVLVFWALHETENWSTTDFDFFTKEMRDPWVNLTRNRVPDMLETTGLDPGENYEVSPENGITYMGAKKYFDLVHIVNTGKNTFTAGYIYAPDIAIFANKDVAWSSQASDVMGCTYWVYPSWAPISDPDNGGKQADPKSAIWAHRCVEGPKGDEALVGIMYSK